MKYSPLRSYLASAARQAIALLLLVVGLAQAGHSAELSITANQLPLRLGPYLDFYEDESAELTIEDMLSSEPPWQRSEQSIPTMGISSSAFWFLIELTSREAITGTLALSSDVPVVDRVEFYFVVNGELRQQSVAGDSVAFSDVDFAYRIPVVPFDLAPVGETTEVYIRAISTSGVEMPLTLSTIDTLAYEQQGQLTFFGAFFTFFLISFCLCAFYYFNMQDRQFLGYTLFFGSALPFFLAQTGMGRVWFWGEVASANNRIGYLSAIGLIVAMCVLGQALSLKTRHKDSINLVLRYVSYLMVPAALFFLFTPLSLITSETVLLIMGLGLSAATCVFVLSGITAAQGSRTALYLFLSWTLIILAYLSMLAYRFTFIERNTFSALVGEWLMILAAFTLLLSMFEYVRSKNEELVQFKLETQAKGDFLRNVSREFLTPVHLILANSKRLLAVQSSKLDEDTLQHVDTVIKQSDHLHNLINDLLEMAELESDSFEPEFELVEMSHFLNKIRDILLPSALEKGLKFNTSFASANLLVQTDVSRLQHALINIITNAIRFTDSGEIVLGYKAVYYRRRLGIEIFISDTGRGMSAEFQQRMFKEFSREEPVSEKDPQGTGLGMVIVKRMIEKLGGEISFESKRGEGSEFFIHLPLRIHSH
jgi:signal transduction histidine kinase